VVVLQVAVVFAATVTLAVLLSRVWVRIVEAVGRLSDLFPAGQTELKVE
jgi:hypothetical protein